MDQISEIEHRRSRKQTPEPRGRERFLLRNLAVFSLVTAAWFLSPHQTSPQTNYQIAPLISHATASQEQTQPIQLQPSSRSLKTTSQDPEMFRNDEARISQTLLWKDTVKLVVADPRLGIPEKDRQFWVSRMLQIIFVESVGNPKASSGIAYGLTQLQPATAKEVAQQYQIIKYDLYNGWDNIFLGLAHQRNLAKRYGPELAGWTHHLGSGNIDQALRTYLISVVKLPVAEVDNIIFESQNNKLLKYIEKYQITPNALLQSSAVTAKLKAIGAWGDQTWEYSHRLIAAGQAMEGYTG